MGLGGISLWQLLIVLLIVVLLFGTKKLRTIGTDLGGAVKGFRKAVTDAEKEEPPPPALEQADQVPPATADSKSTTSVDRSN